MRDFFDWFACDVRNLKWPWLIFGKGPSFAKRDQFDLSGYRTVSLNHVVREIAVDVAHVIDIDVVSHCGQTILENCNVLVVPWHPHVNNQPTKDTLQELVERNEFLQAMDQQGRLLWYNLSTWPEPYGDGPVVDVRYFSAEAVLSLLVKAGAKKVRSLGVDGGASYARQFRDLTDKTLLANRRRTFNKQFEHIAQIIVKTGIDFAPLDLPSPIKVFIATTDAQMLAVKVLEYSIRKHASMTVEVIPMHLAGIDIPVPKEPKNKPRTPFSFQRFLIPQLCDFKDRAIYLDSDMQVFTDIRDLWAQPFGDAEILTVSDPGKTGRKPQFSVMLLNCQALKWDVRRIVDDLDAGRLSYEELMYEMKAGGKINACLDPVWNSLERYKEGETALLHYTDMRTQPWVSWENPLGYLWVRDLIRAIDDGFISRDYVADHVRRGWVRPSLLYQIEKRLDDSLLLSKNAREMDGGFVPPYKAIHRQGAVAWRRPLSYLRAAIRFRYQRSSIYRLHRRIQRKFDLG